MKHFCPKCKIIVFAIAADHSTIVNGKTVVLAGDKTSCGATFLGNQHLTVAEPKSGGSSSLSMLNNLKSPIENSEFNLQNNTMNFSGKRSSQPPSVFSPDGNRVDNDIMRGALNTITFGLSEKAYNALGIEPADAKRFNKGENAGAVAAVVLGPQKGKIAIESIGGLGKSAYEIAKEGGKHASTYKKYLEVSSKEIQKGIRSLEKQIKEHTDLIKNPSETMAKMGKGDYKSLDPRQQKHLVDVKWPGDIKRQQETIDIFKGILRERGE